MNPSQSFMQRYIRAIRNDATDLYTIHNTTTATKHTDQ